MADDRISRNSPCPCGSGKKFKNCCLGKGTQPQPRPARRNLLPAARPRTPSPAAIPTPFSVVDGKLKQVAAGRPGGAAWKTAVLRLSGGTPADERLNAYRLVREAGVLPDEAAGFLFAHAAQWLPATDVGEELDDEAFGEVMSSHERELLRRHGQADLADLMASDRLGYDRRFERGRQYFYGPPDEDLAARLREKGVID